MRERRLGGGAVCPFDCSEEGSLLLTKNPKCTEKGQAFLCEVPSSSKRKGLAGGGEVLTRLQKKSPKEKRVNPARRGGGSFSIPGEKKEGLRKKEIFLKGDANDRKRKKRTAPPTTKGKDPGKKESPS